MLLNLVEVNFGQHIHDVWIAGSVNICVYFNACLLIFLISVLLLNSYYLMQ